MTKKIFGDIPANEEIDILSSQDRVNLDMNNVRSIVPNTTTQKLVVTYRDGTVENIDMNSLVMNLSGGSLDATTQVLTLTSDDGGADVTINLADFVTTQELNNANISNKPTGYTFQNDTSTKDYDVNTVTLKELANVVATYIKERQA